MNTTTLPEQPADLLFPGDLVWMIEPADSLEWQVDEYANAGLLLTTDPATNRGLVAWFDHDARMIRQWWFDGARVERRLESEGVYTFDRVWAKQEWAAA